MGDVQWDGVAFYMSLITDAKLYDAATRASKEERGVLSPGWGLLTTSHVGVIIGYVNSL